MDIIDTFHILNTPNLVTPGLISFIPPKAAMSPNPQYRLVCSSRMMPSPTTSPSSTMPHSPSPSAGQLGRLLPHRRYDVAELLGAHDGDLGFGPHP